MSLAKLTIAEIHLLQKLAGIEKINESVYDTVKNKMNNFLFHGTKIKNAKEIKKHGLIPDFGDIVKSTEAYGYYMDDDYFSDDDRVDGVLFFSESPDTWTYSQFQNKIRDINQACVVVVEKNDTIYYKKDDKFFDIYDKNVQSVDYIDIDKLPPFIEDGDYFSFQEQTPYLILIGEQINKIL